jgi:MoaA/NifB/PqqE/SkfB family radical SAM enzyme
MSDTLIAETSAVHAAVAGQSPGTLAWMRSLLAFFAQQPLDEQSPAAFVSLLRELGIQAHELEVRGAENVSRTVVRACLGQGSETTQGWAVVDPTHRHIFTSPDGRMADADDLRSWPDWVAAERCSVSGSHDIEDWMFWSAGPRSINFQIGDICNMHCIMCWSDRRRSGQPQEEWFPEVPASMVREVLERHLTEIDSVELVSYGEPMANPQFDEIVRAIGELGHRRRRPFILNVITNGSLLRRRQHMNVVRQPGYLTFSIDAADQQTYEFIREGADWHEVIGNLRAAVKHPERHPDRKIGVNMTVFEPNIEGVFAMGALAAGLELDYLSILHGTALELTRADGMETDRRDPRLIEQLARIRKSFPWLTLNDYATGRTLPALPAQTLPGRGFCPLPWRQFDVGQDGRAHPCCRSYTTDLGSPAEAWLGEPLRELRRQILRGHVDAERFAACAACPNLGFENPSGGTQKTIRLHPVR